MADLQNAVAGVSIAGISDVRSGDDDGEFRFRCLADGEGLEVSVLIPELSDYPSSHTCMIFGPDDASASVARVLNGLADLAMGQSIIQLLELVARKLETTDHDGDTHMTDSQIYSDDDDDFDDDDDDEVDEYFPDEDVAPKPYIAQKDSASTEHYTKPTSIFRHRIRADLMTAKANGFKVGHLGGLMDGLGCYVTLSCRISKLGISEEAMRAWQVEPTEYLVAIFHYPSGYKSMDSFQSYDISTARQYFNVRVGICTTYKPTIHEAILAFTKFSREEEKRREEQSQNSSESETPVRGFRNSFISRPLNELLEERFLTLLNYRYNGMTWNGAEEFYNDKIGAQSAHSELGIEERYLERETVSTAYPSLVTADHIQDHRGQGHSLPLIGMQFVLRHFVRCTEFCLICFSKMPDDLQAIKPYVCEKPLCLYQYMSLGFGPSIEHEIQSQPKVVDLLISFCYVTARMGNLKEFPSGLGLMVPSTGAFETDYANFQQTTPNGWSSAPQPQQQPPARPGVAAGATPIRYNAFTREILFDDKNVKCPFRVGDWIVIRLEQYPNRPMHCRVIETTFYPTVKLAEPIVPMLPAERPGNPSQLSAHANSASSTAARKINTLPFTPVDEFRKAGYFIYNQNFDDLHEFHKREAIYALLDIIPSVAEMKTYLTLKAQSSLSSWVDRIPTAALGFLRWIIASNRACIVQVEEAGEASKQGEERLYGMNGWTQFRFAMGAPDKERRFLQAVDATKDRLNLKYPTLFAWHGSPLVNWHSIIREGLHFNHTAHGRAFGHGVYHSLEYSTSIGYSGYGYAGNTFWPMSELRVSQVLALNEIVNAPTEFVSKSPHLVVAQLDWIQTRYLFVKSSIEFNTSSGAEQKPADPIVQDPNMSPRGVNDKVIIPSHASSGSRRTRTRPAKTVHKRLKLSSGKSVSDPIDLDADDDDAASIATLEEDLIILEDEDIHKPRPNLDPLPTPDSVKGKFTATGFLSKFVGTRSTKPLTDFVPGSLDYSTLPMLQEPSWAAPAATKRLMQDFRQLVKVQDKEPLHELGWHVDSDKIENMYQWIVELHSFDPTLPLAKDMKSKGHKSIVLELRFGKDYPMSPPFVRVIRPRFLGFNQGGGGHVTAGGAMCMQLLTNDGWLATNSIESILLQVRMAMSSLDPKPARLEGGGRSDYGVGEAIEAYIRACNTHGWTVPPGFKEMALGGSPDAGFGY